MATDEYRCLLCWAQFGRECDDKQRAERRQERNGMRDSYADENWSPGELPPDKEDLVAGELFDLSRDARSLARTHRDGLVTGYPGPNSTGLNGRRSWLSTRPIGPARTAT